MVLSARGGEAGRQDRGRKLLGSMRMGLFLLGIGGSRAGRETVVISAALPDFH